MTHVQSIPTTPYHLHQNVPALPFPTCFHTAISLYRHEKPFHVMPPGAHTDEQLLVQRAAAGDESAFRSLVRAHEAAVASIVTAMLGTGDDADDVGQETFVKLLRALPQFRGEATVRTYVTRIAMNASFDVLARRRRRAKWLRITGRSDDAIAQLPDLTMNQQADTERSEQFAQRQTPCNNGIPTSSNLRATCCLRRRQRLLVMILPIERGPNGRQHGPS